MGRFQTVALAFLLIVGLPLSTLAGPTRFAVVVGHNIGNQETTTPLRFAQKDASKMAGLFEQLGAVSPEHMRTVIGGSAEDLKTALADIEEAIGQTEGPTELFFYYSGHADPTTLQLGTTRFTLEELRGYLERSSADIRIAIIDACYSGSIIRDKGGRRVPAIEVQLAEGRKATGFAIITSSAAGERSQESEELRGSFFTHFLASGMQGEADSSKDGTVTLEELYDYTYNKTLKRTYQAGTVRQHPTFDYRMTGNGSVVITFPGRSSSRLILPEGMVGNYLFYDPDEDMVLAEVDKKATETRSLAVPPGSYEVYRRSDRNLERVHVTVKEGESTLVPFGKMVKVSRNTLVDKGREAELSVGAKAGYQVFWNRQVRERSLLPSVLGGLELRVDHWLPYDLTPYVEILVGGGVNSQGTSSQGPLAQSFTVLEGTLGLAWAPLTTPFRIELSPSIGVFYVRRTVETGDAGNPVEDSYVSASPGASLTLSKQLFRNFTLAFQGRTGYLYFREDGTGKHLVFSEFFLTAWLNL